ncbi:MAG: hypothetical protein ACRDS9_25475, partial [Pseudonocardiaceae bacterium]
QFHWPSQLLRVDEECPVTEPSPMQRQPVGSSDGQAMWTTSADMPRRVSVKARQGKDATVVVTVTQGTVWMSIVPPFTWEAIMEPGKVDAVIRTLELARDEAKRETEERGGWPFGRGKATVR